MGFLLHFLRAWKIFVGLYCEKFLNFQNFLQAAEDYLRDVQGFFNKYAAPKILKFLK